MQANSYCVTVSLFQKPATSAAGFCGGGVGEPDTLELIRQEKKRETTKEKNYSRYLISESCPLSPENTDS